MTDALSVMARPGSDGLRSGPVFVFFGQSQRQTPAGWSARAAALSSFWLEPPGRWSLTCSVEFYVYGVGLVFAGYGLRMGAPTHHVPWTGWAGVQPKAM